MQSPARNSCAPDGTNHGARHANIACIHVRAKTRVLRGKNNDTASVTRNIKASLFYSFIKRFDTDTHTAIHGPDRHVTENNARYDGWVRWLGVAPHSSIRSHGYTVQFAVKWYPLDACRYWCAWQLKYVSPSPQKCARSATWHTHCANTHAANQSTCIHLFWGRTMDNYDHMVCIRLFMGLSTGLLGNDVYAKGGISLCYMPRDMTSSWACASF